MKPSSNCVCRRHELHLLAGGHARGVGGPLEEGDDFFYFILSNRELFLGSHGHERKVAVAKKNQKRQQRAARKQAKLINRVERQLTGREKKRRAVQAQNSWGGQWGRTGGVTASSIFLDEGAGLQAAFTTMLTLGTVAFGHSPRHVSLATVILENDLLERTEHRMLGRPLDPLIPQDKLWMSQNDWDDVLKCTQWSTPLLTPTAEVLSVRTWNEINPLMNGRSACRAK